MQASLNGLWPTRNGDAPVLLRQGGHPPKLIFSHRGNSEKNSIHVRVSEFRRATLKVERAASLHPSRGRKITLRDVRPDTIQETVPRNPGNTLRLRNLAIPVSASTPDTP